MVRLILHVGLHKCGSTFIQNTLFENAEALRAAKILYPRTGLSLDQPQIGRRHTRISLAARKLGPDAPLFHALHREIAASSAETVVISHEGMSEPGGDPGLLRQVFERYDTHVVLYARSPASYVESRYRSSIRTNAAATEIDQYIEHMRNRLAIRSTLERWRDAFGTPNVAFHPFETIAAGYPLANHLLESGGVRLGLLRPTQSANLRDDNARLLLRLVANQTRTADMVRLSERSIAGAVFDYGSNEGRLISDRAMAELEAFTADYDTLLTQEGHRPLADTLAARPFDDQFFATDIRERARRVVEEIRERAGRGSPIRIMGRELSQVTLRKAAGHIFGRTFDRVRRVATQADRKARGYGIRANPPPVVIMMRYSVLQERAGKANWHISRDTAPEVYRANLFADDRLELRLRTLRRVVLPALAAQSLPMRSAHHRLVVFTSTELPQRHLANLRDALKPYDWITLELVPPDQRTDYARAALAALRDMGVRDGPFATVRLDDDDALARRYIENLSLHIRDENVGRVVTFPHGYIGILEPETAQFVNFFRETLRFNAQGLAAIGRLENDLLHPGGLETIYDYQSHDRIEERHSHIIDRSFRAFVRSVYPQQDTGGIDRRNKLASLHPVSIDKVRRDFDLGDIPPAT